MHAGPSSYKQYPSKGMPAGGGGEAGGVSTANQWRSADSFTTMHPGLFAGGGQPGEQGSAVEFDYFRFTDNERFAR